MSYWNYRVMAHESAGEIFFQIHEVHYQDDKPVSYTGNGAVVRREEVKTLAEGLVKMINCYMKPALWYGDRFPEEYCHEPS